jgi:glycosyltransferase involved in cell wall biosynthesis
MIAAETGARVAIIVAQGGRDTRPVSRYGPLTVVRLDSSRQRGSAVSYLFEYLDFLHQARGLIKRNPRFRQAKLFHVHSLPDFLVAATGPAQAHGAKVILDLHELFPEFTRSRFGGWRGAVGERVARTLEGWSRRRADTVLTVNHAVAEQLRSRPARKEESIQVVHNFADPGEFGAARLTTGVVEGPLRLVYHGTLTPLYGLDLAIEGIALARKNGIEAGFDVYGSGPAEADLERQIRQLGLSDFVRLCGTVSHHRLRELLPTYHAGLVPTRLDGMTRFSLSTKLLEYIHLGLPVILPSIPTYLRYFPENTAWYFTPNSPASLATTLGHFVQADSAERRSRALGAQRSSGEKLDAARDAEVLRRLYRHYLGMNG